MISLNSLFSGSMKQIPRNFFASLVSRTVMVRKGWTCLDVPSGWVQVLRGSRPPSQQWRSAKRRTTSIAETVGQRQQRTPPSPSVRAQQFRQARVPESVFISPPDEVAAMAQQRVLGDEDTPEESHPRCFEEGESCSPGHPSAVGTEQFVARCEKRVAALDTERSRELERLEEGKANLKRLRQIVTSQQVAPLPDSSSEVEQLRLQVAQLQQELAGSTMRETSGRCSTSTNIDCGRISCPCAMQTSSSGCKIVKPIFKTQAVWSERINEVVPRDCRDSIWDSQSADLPSMATNFTRTGAQRNGQRQGRSPRVGETGNPSPTSKRRRIQRSRALQRFYGHWQ